MKPGLRPGFKAQVFCRNCVYFTNSLGDIICTVDISTKPTIESSWEWQKENQESVIQYANDSRRWELDRACGPYDSCDLFKIKP